MHPLNWLRTIPPGGAPLGLDAIARSAAQARSEASITRLQTMLHKRFGTEHIFFTSSGRGALSLLFAALHRHNPERRQVLVPAYVSYSVPSAVVRAGCRIALYDVNPNTLAPDMESLRKAVSGQTLAVLAAHQFGIPFDVDELAEICNENGAILVDDAAQVMGAKINGKDCGLMGDAGIFSMSRGKPFTAVEGGILITRNTSVADQIKEHRYALGGFDDPASANASTIKIFAKALALSMLRRPEIYKLPASMPCLKIGASIFDPDFGVSDFTSFQAGLAADSFARLDEINDARKRKAAMYSDLLSQHPQASPVAIQPGSEPVYLRYPLLPGNGWPKDKSFHAALARTPARRLGISPGFPQAICDVRQVMPFIDKGDQHFSGAHHLARNLVTLPTHNQVRGTDAREGVKVIAEALKKGAGA